MKKPFFALTLALLGVALAHSELTTSTPTNGAVVKTMPKTVVLNFSGGVETDFSTFKVYQYTGEVTRGQLRYFARQQMALKNDAAKRADAGTVTSGTSSRVTINLKPNLKPGVYVVMWHLLSVDTHTVDDFAYFTYKP
jgi:methionine-rich copper-binding protein CopC